MGLTATFYAIAWWRSGRVTWSGPSLCTAAKLLEPGTVYGVGMTAELAEADAQGKVEEARLWAVSAGEQDN
jgi:hypothetical protein